MKRIIPYFLIVIFGLAFIACSSEVNVKSTKSISRESQKQHNGTKQSVVNKGRQYAKSVSKDQTQLTNYIKNKYKNMKPSKWGEKLKGIISRIDTQDKIIALTFDACGGPGGNKYDEKLISYLIKEKVPATLFLNARWIDANIDTFKRLSGNALFEIENHGYLHKPLSVNGKSAYKIKGTNNINEVINEVYLNERKIMKLTGRRPKYFRAGTAFYDDISIDIVKELGESPVNFNIIGDAGATYSVCQIVKACSNAKNGSIMIFHINQPKGSTAEGIIKTIPLLRKKGFRFVHLEDYDGLLK
jgi:peptidoglycan/xylan/chitin deacetylase (PgdA/CDA1 family)